MTANKLQSWRLPATAKAAGDNEYHQHLSLIHTNLLQADAHLSGNEISGILDTLDPFLDTLPYLYLLHKLVQQEVSQNASQFPRSLYPDSQLFRQIVVFLEQCDAVEVRYMGFEWRYLVEVLCESSSYQPQGAESTLEHILLAMHRIGPQSNTLTSLHLRVLASCLESRNYALASRMLDRDLHRLPSPTAPVGAPHLCSKQHRCCDFITQESGLTAKISSTDVSSYFLLGAMVYIAQLNWPRATFMLELVLAVPTSNVASALMVEAYKKWLLVRLFLEGKRRFSLPMTNQAAMKHIKAVSKPYETLADAYRHSDPRKLRAEISEGDHIWTQDGNQGLVRKLLSHQKEITVKKVRDVYMAVTLNQVAEKLNTTASEAKSYVETLIETHKLRAIFRKSAVDNSTVLQFVTIQGTIPHEFSEEALREKLLNKTQIIQGLAKDVSEAEQYLALCREHLEQARRLRKPVDDRGDVEEETIDMTYHAFESEEEENIMSELG